MLENNSEAGDVDAGSRKGSHSLIILFKIPEAEASVLCKAVAPEAESLPSQRASVRIRAAEEGLILEIEAKDLIALRAAVNSFLRFLSATMSTLKIIREP